MALYKMTNGIEISSDNFVNEALMHIYGECVAVKSELTYIKQGLYRFYVTILPVVSGFFPLLLLSF